MFVNNINYNTSINFLGTDKKIGFSSFFGALKRDIFIKRTEADSNADIKSKKQKVPFGVNVDFIKCPKTKLDEIFKQIPSDIKEAAEESIFAGKMTKEMYDEKYGKNKYVIVSIGTSPAGIAKAMEYMGVDVRYVPISNIDELSSDEKQKALFEKKEELKEYKDFLDSIGLNEKNIKKSKKQYIFIDYTASGKSLAVASDISKHYLGLDSKNVSFESINDKLMERACSKPTTDDYKRVKDYVSRYMSCSVIEHICGIPHVHYENLNSIKMLQEQNKSEFARFFEFAICHYLRDDKKCN